MLTNGTVAFVLTQPLFNRYPPITLSQIEKHHTMIVLGGGLSSYKKVTAANSIAQGRILKAVEIYQQARAHGVHYTIYITGGTPHGRAHSEAQVYKRAMVQSGVLASDIVLETRSKNTYENAEFMAKMLKGKLHQPIVLVTSALHMPRAMQYFQHFGFQLVPAVSDYPAPAFFYGLPLSYNLTISQLALHEYFGMLRFDLLH